MRLVVLVVLCGCWRGGTDTPTTTSPPASTPATVSLQSDGIGCNAVAGNVHEILKQASDSALVTRADRLRDAVRTRCNTDHWSVELRRCLATASSMDVADDCENLATPEQQAALEQEVDQIEASE